MNPARDRMRMLALVLALTASALETPALAAGAGREVLLLGIAAAMVLAILFG